MVQLTLFGVQYVPPSAILPSRPESVLLFFPRGSEISPGNHKLKSGSTSVFREEFVRNMVERLQNEPEVGLGSLSRFCRLEPRLVRLLLCLPHCPIRDVAAASLATDVDSQPVLLRKRWRLKHQEVEGAS